MNIEVFVDNIISNVIRSFEVPSKDFGFDARIFDLILKYFSVAFNGV